MGVLKAVLDRYHAMQIGLGLGCRLGMGVLKAVLDRYPNPLTLT